MNYTTFCARLRIGSCPSHHSPNDVIPLSTTSNVHSQETMTIRWSQRASQLEAHQGHIVVYVFTRVLRFPDNTIIAWIKDIYHEHWNIIILLLLPLGHISNINSMCSKLEKKFKHIGLMTWTHAYVCIEWHGILFPKNKKNDQKNMKPWLM